MSCQVLGVWRLDLSSPVICTLSHVLIFPLTARTDVWWECISFSVTHSEAAGKQTFDRGLISEPKLLTEACLRRPH